MALRPDFPASGPGAEQVTQLSGIAASSVGACRSRLMRVRFLLKRPDHIGGLVSRVPLLTPEMLPNLAATAIQGEAIQNPGLARLQIPARLGHRAYSVR